MLGISTSPKICFPSCLIQSNWTRAAFPGLSAWAGNGLFWSWLHPSPFPSEIFPKWWWAVFSPSPRDSWRQQRSLGWSFSGRAQPGSFNDRKRSGPKAQSPGDLAATTCSNIASCCKRAVRTTIKFLSFLSKPSAFNLQWKWLMHCIEDTPECLPIARKVHWEHKCPCYSSLYLLAAASFAFAVSKLRHKRFSTQIGGHLP